MIGANGAIVYNRYMDYQFPEIEGLTFRGFLPFDKYLLEKFDKTCKEHDGEQFVSQIPADVTRAAIADKENAVIVVDRQRIVAAGWILPSLPRKGEQRILLGAQVLPEFRDYGLGRVILSWAETRTKSIAQRDTVLTLVLGNEALHEKANFLYLEYGYEPVLTEVLYVRALEGELSMPGFPIELTVEKWSTLTSHRYFEAYREGFRERLGTIEPDREDWIASYNTDKEFRPDLSMLLLEGERPVGMVTNGRVENSGMIYQIAVLPEYRRKHLARIMVEQSCAKFQAEGCVEVQAYVNVNNIPSAQLFSEAGFKKRLTRARYEKKIMLG